MRGLVTQHRGKGLAQQGKRKDIPMCKPGVTESSKDGGTREKSKKGVRVGSRTIAHLSLREGLGEGAELVAAKLAETAKETMALGDP
jgi:hypothetical protein